jgi:DNA polymerase III subunit beta
MNEPAMINVNRAELAKALAFASNGLAKRPVLPVLNGMRVTIGSGFLELSAFDYETSARVRVPGETIGDSDILVDGPELTAVIRALPTGAKVRADIVIENGLLTITSEGTESVLVSFNADAVNEYPALPVVPDETVTVDAAAVAQAVSRVGVCAGRDDTLPVLTGIQVTAAGGTLTLTATDRYRMARVQVPYAGAEFTAILPAAMLVKFIKAADKTGKISLHVGTSTAYIMLSDGVRVMTLRTITGEFPRTDRLIRDAGDDKTVLTADAGALAAAVTRLGKLALKNEPVRFDIPASATGADMTVYANRGLVTVGSQKVRVDVEGDKVLTSFNPGYIGPVLASLDGPVRIGLSPGNASPASIRIPGDDTYVALVVLVHVYDDAS